MGFGMVQVKGRRRFPAPPAIMMAFINKNTAFRLNCGISVSAAAQNYVALGNCLIFKICMEA